MDRIKPLNDFPGATVAYTGTAGSTAAFPAGPGAVVVLCTTAACVRVGEGVTATTADIPVAANQHVVIEVPRGTGAPWRVSAIQIASGGNLYAKPVN